MEQSANGIEKLLWFVYRIIFTLFPAIVFLYITYLFVSYIFLLVPNTNISKILSTVQSISNFNQSIIIIGICVILNSVVEAVGETYFNFDSIVKKQLNEDSIYKKAKTQIQNIVKEYYGIEDDISATEVTYLIRFKSLNNYTPLNNYVWFSYGNHKIASNTVIYLLLLTSIFAPPLICISKGLNLSQMIILYPFQIVINVILIYFILKMVEISVENGMSNSLMQNEITIIPSLIIGILITGLSLKYNFLLVGFSFLVGISLSIVPIIFFLLKFSYSYRYWARKVLIDAFLSINQYPKN